MDVERSYTEVACPLAEGRKHATGCCAQVQNRGLQLRLQVDANAPQTRLRLCGEDLVRNLHTLCKGVRDRPIVFIGHSLGGLVVQNVS